MISNVSTKEEGYFQNWATPTAVARAGFELGAIQYVLKKNLDVRIGEYRLPSAIYNYAEVSIEMMSRVTLPLSNTKIQPLVRAPVIEETVYRLFLQEILLRQVPKKLLRWIGCDDNIIDTKIAACARVTLAAAAFSLIHALPPECGLGFHSPFRLVSAFVCGLMAGTLQELTHNTAYPILFHMSWNAGTIAMVMALYGWF